MDLWDEIYNKIGRVVAYADRAYSELTLEITKEIIDEEFTKGSLPYKVLSNLAESGDKQTLQIAYELIQEVRSHK
jgi:hypothetical protein